MNMRKKIPVIIDTDIGSDIDDTWALVMALNSPELDIKLIVSCTGDTILRAKIIARLLEIAGRSDIPIAIGIPLEPIAIPQAAWAAGSDLSQYPGQILADGIGAIVDMIMASPEPITLIALGPLPNIAAALRRQPVIARKARFVGMHGSVYRGYGDSTEIAAEFNVARYPFACREVFSAPWDITITPLDTCGLVRLTGAKYQAVRARKSPLIKALMQNYEIWAANYYSPPFPMPSPQKESSTLFDAAAVYLAFSEELLVMERLDIAITDDGYTRIAAHGKTTNVAVRWRDLGRFEDLLVSRLN